MSVAAASHGDEQSSMLQLRRLGDGDASHWDRFVLNCSEAGFFHQSGWKRVIEQSFGHTAHYLFAERAGRIHGVLPLVHVKSRLFGNTLSSTPFCVYGGIAADDDQARQLLEQGACELAKRLQVDALEMRNIDSRHSGWALKDLYVTFGKPIDSDPEVNLKAIPRKQRAMVRKGIKAGLQGALVDDLDRFYRVYAESVKNLGTPVFAKRYLGLLMEVFRGQVDVRMITHRGRDIAGVMSFYFKDQVLPYYGGSLPEARAVKGNDFMYWHLMCDAVEQGIRFFDFGRSKRGTGAYSFKKNWGFEPRPLHYEYYLVKAKRVPQINPANPKYRLFINMWQKLPLGVANRIGPLLAKNLG